jgi:ketosteroid isomerase-like protein
MRIHVAPVIASLLLAPNVIAQQRANDAASARESLRAADLTASRAGFTSGFTPAILGAADSALVLLYDGAPVVRGRSNVERLLAAQPRMRDLRMSWEPLRVVVSSDGLFGTTFGATVRIADTVAPVVGRYINVWRRATTADAWRLVVHVPIGLASPRDYVAISQTADGRDAASTSPFARADLAFAKRAGEAGAPTAFAEYVSPDGMTFGGGGELNIGPATVRARMLESRAATAKWEWHPTITFAAPSGDLGATIGEAVIRPAAGGEPSYSKYVTVWQRQPDGSLKFIVDGGSARPASR